MLRGPGKGISATTADCLVTAITVQIPFDLVVPSVFSATSYITLTVAENGATSKAFPAVLLADLIHVATTCELAVTSPLVGRSCVAAVTHDDGILVTAANPAKPGEEIVVYAVGLGQTTPAVKSGEATPSPAPELNSSVYVQFDFRPNATPTRPYPDVATAGVFAVAIPRFVGLTPNETGLYQINIQLPSRFPAIEPCVNSGIIAGELSTIVGSDLTIDLGGLNSIGLGSVTSFDGAAICVQQPQG